MSLRDVNTGDIAPMTLEQIQTHAAAGSILFATKTGEPVGLWKLSESDIFTSDYGGYWQRVGAPADCYVIRNVVSRTFSTVTRSARVQPVTISLVLLTEELEAAP